MVSEVEIQGNVENWKVGHPIYYHMPNGSTELPPLPNPWVGNRGNQNYCPGKHITPWDAYCCPQNAGWKGQFARDESSHHVFVRDRHTSHSRMLTRDEMSICRQHGIGVGYTSTKINVIQVALLVYGNFPEARKRVRKAMLPYVKLALAAHQFLTLPGPSKLGFSLLSIDNYQHYQEYMNQMQECIIHMRQQLLQDEETTSVAHAVPGRHAGGCSCRGGRCYHYNTHHPARTKSLMSEGDKKVLDTIRVEYYFHGAFDAEILRKLDARATMTDRGITWQTRAGED